MSPTSRRRPRYAVGCALANLISGAVWYEIGTASRAGYDVELIVHAMKARKGYLRKEGLR